MRGENSAPKMSGEDLDRLSRADDYRHVRVGEPLKLASDRSVFELFKSVN